MYCEWLLFNLEQPFFISLHNLFCCFTIVWLKYSHTIKKTLHRLSCQSYPYYSLWVFLSSVAENRSLRFFFSQSIFFLFVLRGKFSRDPIRSFLFAWILAHKVFFSILKSPFSLLITLKSDMISKWIKNKTRPCYIYIITHIYYHCQAYFNVLVLACKSTYFSL